MEKGLVQEINRKHVSRRRWRKFWSLMAATAAFCTTYVLILPAITMSRQLVCGHEEHSHVEQCYEQQPVLICGQEADESHTHTDECYTQETVWICGLAETEGHIHTDKCYEEQTAVICGQEEGETHTHTEECFSRQLICGKEAVEPHTHGEACAEVKKTLICTLPEVHTHTDSCYAPQEVLTCTLEEHTHTEFCYDVGPADVNADVETRENWEKAFSKLEFTKHRDENVTAVAMTQLGYRESERNYVVVDELTLNGYTRYGAWYGDPYGDWDAMFASFVLHYAGVDDFGKEQDPAQWAEKIAKKTPDRFQAAGSYQPGIGDLVFYDRDLDGEIDGVGILMEATESTWRVMEGNREDAVSLESYARGDNRINAFAVLGADGTGEESTQPSEDGTGAEDPTEPTTETAAKDPTAPTTETAAKDPTAPTTETTAKDPTESTTETTAKVPTESTTETAATDPTESTTETASADPTEATEKTEYTVTYIANNGTEETGQQKGSGEVSLTWPDFTVPEGKILSSWNTAPDGTGTDYDDGETLELTENLTLYAQWIDESLIGSLTAPMDVGGSTGTSTPKTLSLKKQIEYTGKNVDDYSYRLHLTLDGSTLSAGSTTTVTPTKQRHIGILLDVTETMTATSDWGSSGENKFDAVRSLLEGNDGFLNSLLDGNTYVSVIVVGGQSGYGTYEDLSKQIAAGDKPGDFSNINNNLHLAQGISYVTGLMAAEKYLGNNIDSLVYIVGNNPDTHIKYSDGTLERGTSGNNAANKDYADYQTFMGNHPNLSMYMVGVAPVNRGSTTAQNMGKYSQDLGRGGGYFEADSKDKLKEQLTQIAQTITVKPDKVTGITVKDPLSDNVTLADTTNLTATLTMLDSEGNPKPNPVTIPNKKPDKEAEGTESWVYIENGVLTCKYPTEISGPFELEIAFNIQTKDGIYQPYTDTSDIGTVWGEDSTSPAQSGYFSNGDATATYTLNNTTSTDVAFPKPVVQAPQKATITLTKVWERAEEADKKAVTVKLHRGSAAGELIGTVVLSADNSWTASCDVKILTAAGASNEIFIVEQAVEGFDTKYSAGSVAVVANKTHSITVTNTKKEVKKTATLTVTKVWKGATGTENAVIHVCKSNAEGTIFTDVENSTFTVTNGVGGTKTITLTWTEEMPPKFFVYEDRSDDFYPVITGDGTARTVNIEGQQYSAMELTTLADKGTYTVSITNMASVQMPETGGSGTERYVFSGLALMFGAVLLMQIPKIKPKGGQEAPPSGVK